MATSPTMTDSTFPIGSTHSFDEDEQALQHHDGLHSITDDHHHRVNQQTITNTPPLIDLVNTPDNNNNHTNHNSMIGDNFHNDNFPVQILTSNENNCKETTNTCALNQEGTKKFRSKAFLHATAPSSKTQLDSSSHHHERTKANNSADHHTTLTSNNNSSDRRSNNEVVDYSPALLETLSSSSLERSITNEHQEDLNNNTTKQVDPYSLTNMKSNNQNETSGKRKSSSSIDTITHARKLVSGFGISTKDSKIDLLYATTLSSVSNSRKKHTRKTKTNDKEMERFLFCKYCKLSNRSLDSGRLQLKTCSLCREVRYCCKEHQVADWPKHKFECNCAVRALNNGIYSKTLQKGDETNRPQIGDSISVHYVAKLLNDTIVDKTYKSIETNKHCSVSYDTSDDEEGEEGFDDDKELYIVKPPSNSYNDFENWLSHANNKFLLKQRKSDVDSEDEITSTRSSTSELYDRTSVASSFSDLSYATTCNTTDSRLTFSQRSEDDMSLYSSSSSTKPPITNNEPEDAEENWSTDSSGRGGGTSSSTSTVSIIFDSVAKDVEVVPDLLQFTIGKGQVNADIEKQLCQMSLGERRYLFVSPKARKNNSKQDILTKRVKKLSDFTLVYEIMIVQILRKKQETNHFQPSLQPNTNCKSIYGQDEFTKDNETYQSCFYEPFRRFIPTSPAH